MSKQISATYMDHMGDDLTVINAARVTMGVVHQEMNDRDEKLIKFLAREHHVTPFRHPQVSFRCTAPIAIARQLQKHQAGFSWNEMSRRYKDGAVDIFIPEKLFKRPDNLHDGSGAEFEEQDSLIEFYVNACNSAVAAYDHMLDRGVAPEQARFVLPQGMITEWVWTGSLYGWSEVCRQRLSNHAQYEVRLFAQDIDREMSKLFPIAWEALRNSHENTE